MLHGGGVPCLQMLACIHAIKFRQPQVCRNKIVGKGGGGEEGSANYKICEQLSSSALKQKQIKKVQ